MATCFCLQEKANNIVWEDASDCTQQSNIYCICGAALHRVIRKDYVKKANSGPYMGLGYTIREGKRSCDGCYSEFESEDIVHYCKSGHSYSHHLCQKCTLTKQSDRVLQALQLKGLSENICTKAIFLLNESGYRHQKKCELKHTLLTVYDIMTFLSKAFKLKSNTTNAEIERIDGILSHYSDFRYKYFGRNKDKASNIKQAISKELQHKIRQMSRFWKSIDDTRQQTQRVINYLIRTCCDAIFTPQFPKDIAVMILLFIPKAQRYTFSAVSSKWTTPSKFQFLNNGVSVRQIRSDALGFSGGLLLKPAVSLEQPLITIRIDELKQGNIWLGIRNENEGIKFNNSGHVRTFSISHKCMSSSGSNVRVIDESVESAAVGDVMSVRIDQNEYNMVKFGINGTEKTMHNFVFRGNTIRGQVNYYFIFECDRDSVGNAVTLV